MGRRVDSSSQLSASRSQPASEDFWALKDVSFEINRGEVVGIIGRNGAGKSTLLKILSRITEPTGGRITVEGRIASLLEVGTGFHPELTGRENIFLNGAILGMSRIEIKAKFDEIVAFAEIERFLDTPVKRYSSGMYVRLAFAVAAHLEPEILVIDEVLAVGDVEFQKKCLGKMQDVSVGGRTVLFVSHNMNAVQMLCSKCVFLSGGRLDSFGKTPDMISKYITSQVSLIEANRAYNIRSWSRTGSGEARFVQFMMRPASPIEGSEIRSDGSVEFLLEIESSIEQTIDSCGVTILNRVGYKLLTADSLSIGQTIRLLRGLNQLSLLIPKIHLKPDTYVLSLWLGQTGVHAIDYLSSIGEFELHENLHNRQRKLPDDGPVSCEFTICSQDQRGLATPKS
jgi:lipopolysaccharide transport system ATP-binding protein